MTIHKEGYTSIALCILFILVLNAVVHYLLPNTAWFTWIIYILSFALFVIILQFFRSPAITVIMNNQHVICPADGIVKYYRYHPGKFLVAWHPKSSTENERTTVVIENKAGVSVLFRQIAGALARRIVCYSKEGQQAVQGEEFGFIKFGSRVDLFLPLGTEIKVGLGETVKGGITVLAHLKN